MQARLYLIVFAVVAPGAIADDSSQHRILANPIEPSPSRYPIQELCRNQQRWGVLNYVVTDDGQVVDPVLENSGGSQIFERASMRTLEDWRYEPALLNA